MGERDTLLCDADTRDKRECRGVVELFWGCGKNVERERKKGGKSKSRNKALVIYLFGSVACRCMYST
jgi:hypothetical protein